jgi:hypothetical protein
MMIFFFTQAASFRLMQLRKLRLINHETLRQTFEHNPPTERPLHEVMRPSQLKQHELFKNQPTKRLTSHFKLYVNNEKVLQPDVLQFRFSWA